MTKPFPIASSRAEASLTSHSIGSAPGTQANLAGCEIAVLIPCYNEESAISSVIRDVRQSLPQASIYVYDNCSTDSTAALAQQEGAIVRIEPRRGKGNVVRRMFTDVEADIYILLDGDATYEAAKAFEMGARLFDGQLDMVVGTRATEAGIDAYRQGHRLGNKLLTGTVSLIFGQTCTDMLSGYRVFSRRFVKSFPVTSKGFEIETEITVHAFELGIPSEEIPTRYSARPAGSTSKLNTYIDGVRILYKILSLLAAYKPLTLFGSLSIVLGSLSVVLAIPLMLTFLETGLVPRLPTAILSTGLMMLAVIALACGLTLKGVSQAKREAKILSYLRIPHPASKSQL